MKMIALLATTALVAPVAFMSDVVETVEVTRDGHTFRVNKTDFDADQADGGAKSMTLHKKGENLQSDATTVNMIPEGAIVAPAPSAPAFPVPTPPATEPPAVRNAGAVAPSTISAEQKLVMPKGKKFIVCDATGQPVEGLEGIDEAGYKTQEEAWTAIKKLPQSQGGESPIEPINALQPGEAPPTA